MSGSEPDLQQFCAEAKDLGAVAAVAIAARDIVVDERARLKCVAPQCPYYGRPLCPPNLISVSEFRKILANYRHAILAQWQVTWTQARIERQFGKLGLTEVWKLPEFQNALMSEYKEFYAALRRLEAQAFQLGFRFATALGSGNYEMLYAPNEPVAERPAFRARPAMEGMGIDVFDTALNAGLTLEISTGDAPAKFNGLLLVD